jgi:hypothetical protein
VVEHWASPAALVTHERTEAFIHYGQELVKHATLHDTCTARPFEQRVARISPTGPARSGRPDDRLRRSPPLVDDA